MQMKSVLRDRLGLTGYHKLKQLAYAFYGFAWRGDLVRLGRLLNSDKATFHSYAKHYQHHFAPFQYKRLVILEIGIGGYRDPTAGGESLRMWKAFFPRARIYGLDIYDKSFHDERRIKTFQGSQDDEDFLRYVVSEIGPIDIIIDDGSHVNTHVINTFRFLFPVLKDGGIYAIEDLQTSYWDDTFGGWGGSQDLRAPHTSMNFLKALVDGLNYQEYLAVDYEPSIFDRMISSIHFYHNLAFVCKGINDEPSNRSLFA